MPSEDWKVEVVGGAVQEVRVSASPNTWEWAADGYHEDAPNPRDAVALYARYQGWAVVAIAGPVGWKPSELQREELERVAAQLEAAAAELDAELDQLAGAEAGTVSWCEGRQEGLREAARSVRRRAAGESNG